jgi:hypothetical protein
MVTKRVLLRSAVLAVSLCWLTAPLAVQAATDSHGHSLGIASVVNLRDLGGYAIRSGEVVRQKLLYRSNQLSKNSPDDLNRIAAPGLHRSGCDAGMRPGGRSDRLFCIRHYEDASRGPGISS